MSNSMKTIEVKVERNIAAPVDQVFDAWLNPKVPGTVWNTADKFLLNAKVDGLFFWALKANSHYGRFTEIARPGRIQHTWVSPSTLGMESNVTVTFTKRGEGTLMTLVHSGLPDTEGGRGHEKGWNFFLGKFEEQIGKSPRK